MIEGHMTYSWEADEYKKKRDEYKRRLDLTESELSELKGALSKILENVNSSSDNCDLSYDDFKYYFLTAAHSENESIRDQFESMLMVFVMFFGGDLQQIKTEELRWQREKDELDEKDRLNHIKNRDDYNSLVEKRSEEKEKCIERRKLLLQKISRGRYVIEDFDTQDRSDIEKLYDTGHIRTSIIFNRLIVKNFNDIPVDHDDEYYKAKDHSFYYHLHGHHTGFFLY